jgi:hypothetical protein
MAVHAENTAFFPEFVEGVIMINMRNIGTRPAGQQRTGTSLMLGTVL